MYDHQAKDPGSGGLNAEGMSFESQRSNIPECPVFGKTSPTDYNSHNFEDVFSELWDIPDFEWSSISSAMPAMHSIYANRLGSSPSACNQQDVVPKVEETAERETMQAQNDVEHKGKEKRGLVGELEIETFSSNGEFKKNKTPSVQLGYAGSVGLCPQKATRMSSSKAAAMVSLDSPKPIIKRQRTNNAVERLERSRSRNREHAKRSRLRKKFFMDSLEKKVSELEKENKALKQIIIREIGPKSGDILAPFLMNSTRSDILASKMHEKTVALSDPDFCLVASLTSAQQNFVISNPNLPDNPIVFASSGFYSLTGYTPPEVLGRNCRFLQGPETDPLKIQQIRDAIETEQDVTVCLLNYKKDGTPFWNNFFVAGLRDIDNKVVNYVGVQCEVSSEQSKILRDMESEVSEKVEMILSNTTGRNYHVT